MLAVVMIWLLPASPAQSMAYMTQSDDELVGASPLRDMALDHAAVMGVSKVRALVLNDSNFSWGLTDSFVDEVRARGKAPYLTLTYLPTGWGSDYGGSSMSIPNSADFGDYCEAAAQRYKGKVADYSVWNEPNHFTYGDSAQSMTSVKYGLLYRECYSRIKSVDSAARVYFGEIEAGGSGGCDYVRNALVSTTITKTDGVAIHPYQWNKTPTFKYQGSCKGIGKLDEWRTELDKAKTAAAKLQTPAGESPPLLVTEFGYCRTTACVPGSPDMLDPPLTEDQRDAWLSQALDHAATASFRVSLFSYYHLVRSEKNWDTGLVDRDGTPSKLVGTLCRKARGNIEPTIRSLTAIATSASSATFMSFVQPGCDAVAYRYEYRRQGQSSWLQLDERVRAAKDGVVNYTASVTNLAEAAPYEVRAVARADRTGGPSVETSATFTTPERTLATYVAADNPTYLSTWDSSSPAVSSYTPLFGATVAPGTSPVSLRTSDGNTHTVFANANYQLVDRTRNEFGGHSERLVGGYAVYPGTSPALVQVGGALHVYFARWGWENPALDRKLTLAPLTLSTDTWGPQTTFESNRVAAGTSPTAVLWGGWPHVFYVDSDRGNRLSEWRYTPQAWVGSALPSDPVRTGTSPSAVMWADEPHVFFADSVRKSMNDLRFQGSSWGQTTMWGPELSPNSSPSAAIWNGSAFVAFASSPLGGRLANWSWTTNGWVQIPMGSQGGDPLAAGSSPSVSVRNGVPHVYYANASAGNRPTDWYFGSAGWTQTVAPAQFPWQGGTASVPAVAPSSSPAS